ncbi:MAG: sulfatase [Verrucomicrobiota bacterium]
MNIPIPQFRLIQRLTFATALATASTLSAQTNDQRPNVLMIIVDDMNDYGFYNAYPGTRIPYLDAFKKQAVTFRYGTCASPVCGPSRAAVFSGLYPHTTGSYLNGSNPWQQGILIDIETLPELFKRSGYKNFGNGKLFHAKLAEGREADMFENKPYHGGFGPFVPEEHRIRKTGETKQTKGGQKFWGSFEWEGPDSDFPDVKNADASIAFLQRKHDEPFFLMYGLWRPHTPFTAPKRFFEMYDPADIALPKGYLEGDLSDIPPYGHFLSGIWGERWKSAGKDEPENWKRILHGYLACTSFADWNCGRVIEALDASPYGENTIVVFWSDNGFHLGEKDHYEKATVWEVSALTPFAIRLSKNRNGGKTCIQPVSTIDIYPTLIDYCDLESPAHATEGLSLRQLLENPNSSWDRPAITTYGEGVFSARSKRFRYIRYPDGLE